MAAAPNRGGMPANVGAASANYDHENKRVTQKGRNRAQFALFCVCCVQNVHYVLAIARGGWWMEGTGTAVS